MAQEATVEHMSRHMRWPEGFGEIVAHQLSRQGLVRSLDGGARLALTDAGRALAQEVMLR
jgi:hypothetical protein